MEQSALKKLAAIVYDYCGIDYETNLTSFNMKINRRLRALQLTTVEQYIRYLKQHDKEWEPLIEAITINETYFFREDRQLSIYQTKLLPQLQQQLARPIRVWSAACSTGEEPYTLAMLAADKGITLPAHIQITASDINQHVLNIAKQGRYFKTSLSLRRIQAYWLKTYFEEQAQYYEIKDSIKNLVDYQSINLKSFAQTEQQPQYDVIFCRNVFIYFDEQTIQSIVAAFYRALKPGGYLFLGHAETITHLKNTGFTTVNEDGTFYYRKGL